MSPSLLGVVACAMNSSAAEEEQQSATDLGVLVGLISLATSFVVGFKLEQWDVHWLPESAAAVCIGLLACVLVSIFFSKDVMSMMRFDMDFFMNWLIPPIIFEAAFNMNVGAFFASIRPTMFFAFVGTLFSTFVVAGIVFSGGQLGLCYPLSPLAALTFGSLISATDPVAVLATFQALGVREDLFAMVFGEAVLNDAIAIVLTKTLVSFTRETASMGAVVDAVSTFGTIFFASMGVGLAFGCLSALTFKHLKLREHPDTVYLECVLSFTFPWSAYFLAEACEYSGIVSILFCGMTFATCNHLEARPSIAPSLAV